MMHLLKLVPTFASLPIYYLLIATVDSELSVPVLMFVSACGVVGLFDFGISIKPNFEKRPLLPGFKQLVAIYLLQCLILKFLQLSFFYQWNVFNVVEASVWQLAIYTLLMSVTNHARIALDLNFLSTTALSFIRGSSSLFRLAPALLVVIQEYGILIFLLCESSYIAICYHYSTRHPQRNDFQFDVSNSKIKLHWVLSVIISVIDLMVRNNLALGAEKVNFYIYDIVSRSMVLVNLFSSFCIRLIQTHTNRNNKNYDRLFQAVILLLCISCLLPFFGYDLAISFLYSLALVSVLSVLDLGRGSLTVLIKVKSCIIIFFLIHLTL